MAEKFFYVTASDLSSPQGGVYVYTLNAAGKLQQKGFAPLFKAGYLSFSPDRKFLYATGADAQGNEGAAALKILPDGGLEKLNFVSSMGKSTCHCNVSPDGGKLYTANYFSSTVAEFNLDPASGKIVELTNLTFHSGTGPNKERQECAHPHFSSFAPDGKVIVCDLGADRLYAYNWSAAEGLSIAGTQITSVTPAGSGPRHLVFAPDGQLAYLINELGNTVQSYSYTDGKFTLLNSVSTLPPDFHDYSKASAIRMDATGRFLLVGNRGYDSVATIALDQKGGLQLVDIIPADGKSPRDVNFLPGEKFCASANEFSDNVTFFEFDNATGQLRRSSLELHLPCPRCILY